MKCRKIDLAQPGAQPEYHVGTFRHSDLGLERDHGLEHRQGSGIGRRVGPAGLAQDVVDLGEALDDPVGHLEDLLGFGDGDARHGRGHIEKGPLVERRHELGAELEEDGNRGHDQQEGGADDEPRPLQRPAGDRVVDPHQEAADRVGLLVLDLADQDRVGRPAEPARPEVEAPGVSEQDPQRRVQGDGQASRR